MSSAVSISTSKLVVTPIMSTKTKFIISQNSKKNLIRNADYNGYISKPTVKKIGNMVENMVFGIDLYKKENRSKKKLSQIQPTFITLTLSYGQIQNDKYIKRNMLMRFIEQLKSSKGVQNYIWRAEPQVNGNIHFHILIDRFVKWEWIRKSWNNIQAKHEYIDAFEQKHNHRNPNSTDIHGLREVNNIAAYICKYMVKDKPLRKIEGRIWGCSKNFHKVKNPRVEVCQHIIEDLEELVKENKVYKKVLEYCTIFRYKKSNMQHTINDIIYNIYVEFVHSLIKIKV